MNHQLIEKVIKSNNGDCPNFVYENPVLDRNVARALSSSFVKILSTSGQNSKINNNLRFSILENIRKMCQIEPKNHVTIDDSLVQTLTELYQMHTLEATTSQVDPVEKQLDAFLIRRFTQMEIIPRCSSTLNPEIIQALINLNDKGVYLGMLSNDIIHWHIRNGNYMCLLKELWDQNLRDKFNSNVKDDISLKMKAEIEKMLLNICLEVLSRDFNLDRLLEDNAQLTDLVNKCGYSPMCFQICSGILNFIFIMTNFEMRMQMFIPRFIKLVKKKYPGSASRLYPIHLNNLVILMDFDVNDLPSHLKEQYINSSLPYMRNLHKESESDLILLLSHFPQWFDIYFGHLTVDT
ncbi:uncharacterized protein LOC132903252 [Amyelois transitella]|uniref:uncharacterized protein LOC132903252 n=1 Tax=Amyelois transitella TaxID=680683 RepID=UPI00298F6B90|nr:uncharacterized protein LOC132903252 [Amyelois transitella]